MPHQDPHPTDPMTLHGVMFETDSPDAMRVMAECFIQEYCRMGFSRRRIANLFTAKGYAGPNLACQTLGEAAILGLIDECLLRWGPRTNRLPLESNEQGDFVLPVID